MRASASSPRAVLGQKFCLWIWSACCLHLTQDTAQNLARAHCELLLLVYVFRIICRHAQGQESEKSQDPAHKEVKEVRTLSCG